MRLQTANEPGRVASGALAVLVHVMFFALLVFGVSWQKKIAGPMVVDLWQDLPDPVNKVLAPPEPSRPMPKPEPEARPKPQPKPEPKSEPKPAPEVRKEMPAPPPPVALPKPSAADIDIKEKLRKQKEDEVQRLEEQKKADLEKRRLDEEQQRKAIEDKRQEAEKQRLEQEALQREDEARRAEDKKRADEQRRVDEAKLEEERKLRAAAVERERQQQEAARKLREAEESKSRAEAAVRAARQKSINDYMARIQARVVPRIVMPQDLKGRPEGIYEVTLLPGGDVLEIRLKRSSGVALYDRAVERAINAASPLPVPDDPDLFQEHFRTFDFRFQPPS